MDLEAINNLLTGSAIIFTLAMLTAWYKQADNNATGFGVLAALASTFGAVFSLIENNYDTTWIFAIVAVLAGGHNIWGSSRYKAIDHAD